MTNARRTHRSAGARVQRAAIELGSNKSRAPEALGEPGNPPGATRLKLVKNCSNFPLVKQMSQGNMPPAIATSEAAPPPFPYPIPHSPLANSSDICDDTFRSLSARELDAVSIFCEFTQARKADRIKWEEVYRRADTP